MSGRTKGARANELTAEERDLIERRQGPVHSFFSLSYSNYLVIPRSILQEMPVEWQERFVSCLEEARATFQGDELDVTYCVHIDYPDDDREGCGHDEVEPDPLANYRHPNEAVIERLRVRRG